MESTVTVPLCLPNIIQSSRFKNVSGPPFTSCVAYGCMSSLWHAVPWSSSQFTSSATHSSPQGFSLRSGSQWCVQVSMYVPQAHPCGSLHTMSDGMQWSPQAKPTSHRLQHFPLTFMVSERTTRTNKSDILIFEWRIDAIDYGMLWFVQFGDAIQLFCKNHKIRREERNTNGWKIKLFNDRSMEYWDILNLMIQEIQ